MASRLAELAGCTATAEEFFLLGADRDQASSDGELGVVQVGKARRDDDSSLGFQLECLLQQSQNAHRSTWPADGSSMPSAAG
jgi:hypothetical protein